MLAYLWTVIADLYGDAAKRRGRHNVQEQLKQLKVLLNNYDFDVLGNFFASTLWFLKTQFEETEASKNIQDLN